MKPVIGKKVVLFEIEPVDIPSFAEAHRDDKHGYMQAMNLSKMTQAQAESYVALMLTTLQMTAFVVMTKEGKASRRVGYVYVTDITEHGCSISGIMLKEFAKGLGREIRRGKYTYSEDSLFTLVDWLYTNFKKLDRIQADVVATNKLSLALLLRAGFTLEGTLRNYLHLDDKTVDVCVHSLLRSEWKRHEFVTEEANYRTAAV